ncbi:MAG: DNA repair protein RecO [Elusimicrobiota bacterium]|nr:MAG: DNA repair protein RecO [Elusimicrobiota bacterium]
MIVNAGGVILSRRAYGEYDRLCSLFTESLGKVPVRFVGVNRPKGKMKAMSEPGVWAEHRLHLSPRSEFAKGVGGRLIASFPGWRDDLGRTFDALACLEMLDKLTPDRLPAPSLYRLLCATLAALEQSPSRWLVAAFGLRLADKLGFGLRERAPAPCGKVWRALHEDEPAALALLPYEPAADEAARRLLDEHLGAQAGRRLRAFEFREDWQKSRLQGAPAC